MNGRILWRGALLGLASLLWWTACTDGRGLRARRVESQAELIGGPTAKGKVGDYLLENDRIRVVISGPGPTFTAGLFGGTVLDVDLQRTRSQDVQGRGFDAFAEAFPLANLLIVNPMNPTRAIRLSDAGVRAEDVQGAVSVFKDGSDGQEAVIRVTGHSAYIFDVLKMLNRDFLEGMLNPLTVAGLELDMYQLADLLPALVGEPDLNLFGLLNRLQISFDFQTDYILRPGEPFLRQVTTVTLAPQSDRLLQGCPPTPCDKTCEFGYAVAEFSETVSGASTPYKRMCPVCQCAEAPAEMATFNESRDFFQVLLGTLDGWVDPLWKGGVVTGDFLFFGSDAPPFAPGFGFDIDRKVYEDLWQGVGTMGSPIAAEWVAGVGENVSYAWATVNPRERRGFDCPGHRLAIVRITPDREDAVAQALTGQNDLDLAKNLAARDAAARVRQAIVDRRPIPLVSVPTDRTSDPGNQADPALRDQAYRQWVAGVLSGPGQALAARFGEGVDLDLLPAHDCLPSRVLVPLFTTSATAVLTHFAEGDTLKAAGEDAPLVDDRRAYTFTRYLSVGEGDVATAVAPLYGLRGTPTGTLEGVVFEDPSRKPLSHIDVFLLQDPREKPEDPIPTSFAAYRRLAVDRFGNSGIVSHFQSDVGLRDQTEPSGSFEGPVPPGRYLAMAHDPERGSSALEPVEVRVGERSRVLLFLQAPGEVAYRVTDQAGNRIPARLSFQALDETGKPLDWDGTNEPELGDHRYDHGVRKAEHSGHGEGTVRLAPGRYRVLVSRGMEYAVAEVPDLEVAPAQTVPLQVTLVREVDTTGWLAGDFHVHAVASVDSSLPMETRIRAAVAEGLEVVAATDHDHIVDYGPWIRQEGLENFLKYEVAAEVSPLEYGHFNAFPMRYDDTSGFVHGAPGWHGLTMRQIFDRMREMRDGPPESFVMEANHPRDGFMGYLAQLGVKGYDMTRKRPGMELCNQVMSEAPCDFDSFEVQNGKNLQYLHTPTVGEAERHNRCYREILDLRDAKRLAFEPGASVCAWLLVDPVADCDRAEAAARDPALGEAERLAWAVTRDHCAWHREAREAFDAASKADGLLSAKRQALEALKALSLRYQLERTDLENDAFFNTTSEEQAASDPTKFADVGCSQQKACEACVGKRHPECAKKVSDGGTGWTTACVIWCRDECPEHDARPCTDRFEVLEDWFHFLDIGFDKVGVANSDSHGTAKEIGHPRTYVQAGTDSPAAADVRDVNRAMKAGRVTLSSGAFIEFSLRQEGTPGQAAIGDVLTATGDGDLLAHIRVQTPSWYRVERIEVWSNSRRVKQIFVDPPKEAIEDFNAEVRLPRPEIDSWYLVIAYGTSGEASMSPVYKREPYGNILISTVIALAADQLLANFSSLLDKVSSLGLDVSSLLGSLELPDSYPSFAWGATNPIRVDVDGGGFRPPRAVDTNGDGVWDPPPFCSVPCDPSKGEAACPAGQACLPRIGTSGADAVHVCQSPTPEYCVGLQRVSP